MARFLLITGDFSPTGGMDRANHALASYLAARGDEVHLVSHRVSEDLATRPGVTVHLVPRPLGAHVLGQPLLARAGMRQARRLTRLPGGARVVVNGGNCPWGDINWVQYVHAAWRPQAAAGVGAARRVKALFGRRIDLQAERTAVRRARLVVANSRRTAADLIGLLGVPTERVQTIYYGTDPERFRPPSDAERAAARAAMGWTGTDDRPAVAFVGALGDRRKGLDTLFEAWKRLAQRPSWDARLVVVGTGSSLPAWRARADAEGLAGSVSFLGFRTDVPEILRACDLLVSPTRYEAYGLNVQEALCCGMPALVSASAGVAERYPPALADLLLPDPDDATELADRLLRWRAGPGRGRPELASFSRELRGYTWDDMADRFMTAIAATA